jgi:hypothetical protein
MIGAPPPADAAGPFQNKYVKALAGLLSTIFIGALFGTICAFVVLALAALFGDVAGVTGSSSLEPSVLSKLVAPSLAAAKAGAINFTLARYLLLSKSKLRGILTPLAAITITGGLFGMVASLLFIRSAPLITAEMAGTAAFWFASLAICQRDDNKGRDYFSYKYRR